MSESNLPNQGLHEPDREHPISPDVESDDEAEESEDGEHNADPRRQDFRFDPVYN